MTNRGGRRVALWSAVVGIAMLAATGYAFRGRIQEEYWLWRLKAGGDSEAQLAFERIGEINCGMKDHDVHTIRYLVAAIERGFGSVLMLDSMTPSGSRQP